jgi:hypothetical protein
MQGTTKTGSRALLLSGLLVGILAVQVLFYRRPTPGLQLGIICAWLALLVILLASAARVRAVWRQRGWRALFILLPPLMAVGASCVAPAIGDHWSLADFQRERPFYDIVVERADTSTSRRTILPSDSLPFPIRRIVHRVLWWRDSVGVLGVEFWAGGGFPARHVAYLYYTGDTARLKAAVGGRWRIRRSLGNSWYEVRN